MKVLQVGKYYPPYNGGIETYLYNLCMELKNEVDLEVLVSNTGRKTVIHEVDGIKVTRVGRIAKFASTDISLTYLKQFSKRTPDIIHIHCPNPLAVICFLLSRNKKSKLVITYHNDIIRQKVLIIFYKPFLKKLLKKAERIFVHNNNYAHSSTFLQPHLHKVVSAPPGIDITRFSISPYIKNKMLEITQSYGNKIVLFIGRLVYYKGLEYLIESMKNVSAVLVIIGNGPLKNKLPKLSKRLSVHKKIHFLGNVDEQNKVAYLRSSSLLCLPSTVRSEAFGIVQLEGMICEKPIINTFVEGSGVSSVSINNETGITVPPKNAAALSEAINYLLANPSKSKTFGKSGAKRVLEFYTREKTSRKILRTYKEILSSKEAQTKSQHG